MSRAKFEAAFHAEYDSAQRAWEKRHFAILFAYPTAETRSSAAFDAAMTENNQRCSVEKMAAYAELNAARSRGKRRAI